LGRREGGRGRPVGEGVVGAEEGGVAGARHQGRRGLGVHPRDRVPTRVRYRRRLGARRGEGGGVAPIPQPPFPASALSPAWNGEERVGRGGVRPPIRQLPSVSHLKKNPRGARPHPPPPPLLARGGTGHPIPSRDRGLGLIEGEGERTSSRSSTTGLPSTACWQQRLAGPSPPHPDTHAHLSGGQGGRAAESSWLGSAGPRPLFGWGCGETQPVLRWI